MTDFSFFIFIFFAFQLVKLYHCDCYWFLKNKLKTYNPMVTAELLTIAKIWKQSVSINKW